jgi:choline transport protein
VPLLGIAVVTSIAALLGFVNLGSTTAFNDIISLTLEGLFTSYLVAVALLLYRRLRGEIGERADDQAWDSATLDEARCPTQQPFTWGPWRVPGIWGIINNIIACIYLVVICFFSFWPSETPVEAVDMNYSQTVWGAVVLVSILYYVFFARHWYKGPVVEVELLQARD